MSIITTLAACLFLFCLLGAITGAIWPKAILWWAAKEKRNRWRAILFALYCSLIFVFLGIAGDPKSSGGMWLLFMVSTIPSQICFERWNSKKYKENLVQNSIKDDTKNNFKENLSSPEIKNDEKINQINTNYQIPYQIDAEHVECTCSDWIERRSKEPEHSPFRVCEHLASYYTNHYSRIPKKLYPYRMLIVSFSRKNRLLPYGGEGNNTLIDEDGIGIITQVNESPMVTVYRNDKEYKYDPKTNRWEYGNIPPNSPQITKSIPLTAAPTPIMNFTSEEGIPFQSFSSPAMYTIYPERAECTCPDWVESRSNEPLESPCRVCKHLAYYYSQHFSSLPKELAPFLRLIAIRGAHKRGLPYGGGLTFPYMGGERPALIEFSTGSPWVSIYIDSLRYGFNFEENRWSYGEMPSKAAKFSTFIHHQLGIVGSSQALTSANGGYTFENSVEAISEPITWEKNVLPMLEDALGEKLPHEVEWVERKGYFVIYRGKSSNWICRVYYGANYIKYIMLKDKSTLHMKSGERLYKRDCPKLKEAFHTKSQ